MDSCILSKIGKVVVTVIIFFMPVISTIRIQYTTVSSYYEIPTPDTYDFSKIKSINNNYMDLMQIQNKYNSFKNYYTAILEQTKLIVKDLNNNNENDLNNEYKLLKIDAREAFTYKAGDSKIAFLTFDDGPSRNVTPLILKTLDDYKIKATFFVIGVLCEINSDILSEIYKNGHSIGNHSYSHDYIKLYESEENFFNELKKTEEILKNILRDDFKTQLFRFPGGCFESYKLKYLDCLEENEYKSIDWNSLTGDSERLHPTYEYLLERFKETTQDKKNLVILMHDASAKETTAQVLPEIIEYLISEGYQFAVLK